MLGKLSTRVAIAIAALLLGATAWTSRVAAAANQKIICLEAEAGKTTAPVTLYKGKECSGDAAIEVVQGANPEVKEGDATPILSGDCVLTFKVAVTGTYQAHGRAWWLDGCGNSFYLTFDRGDRMTLSSGTYRRWHWVRGPRVRLSAGTHTLKIANSEDGARLDQVFLTCDPKRSPAGKEKATAWALVP
ncbi:MAG: hypothetical protein HY321_04355 [Armatimonadetes bacterium]|nr:hypothetical protein [Armatimonadota bacterium]